jgi:hypothetical protein
MKKKASRRPAEVGKFEFDLTDPDANASFLRHTQVDAAFSLLWKLQQELFRYKVWEDQNWTRQQMHDKFYELLAESGVELELYE